MKNILYGTLILLIFSCNSANPKKESQIIKLDNSEFTWDFRTKKKFIYSFTQTVDGTNKVDKTSAAEKTFLTGKGYLYVSVKENNLADLSLSELNFDMIMFNENGKPRDTITDKTPPAVIEDMKPNGNFSNPNSNIMFDLLFPLPSAKLNVGESDNIPMQIPFNVNGSSVFCTGFHKLTFKGYDTICDRKCAVLKGELDVSKLDIPQELKAKYKSVTTGSSTYYFDLENHCYVGADIQMLMLVLMDDEPDNEDVYGFFMEMSNDNIFKIRLEKIEE